MTFPNMDITHAERIIRKARKRYAEEHLDPCDSFIVRRENIINTKCSVEILNRLEEQKLIHRPAGSSHAYILLDKVAA